jgi:hypothetical protein
MNTEALVEETIAGTYSEALTIRTQLDQLLQINKMIQMSIDSGNSKTHVQNFLMDQLGMTRHPIGLRCLVVE